MFMHSAAKEEPSIPVLRYGKNALSVAIPKAYDTITYVQHDTVDLDERSSLLRIRQALEAPIGTPPLRELAAGKGRAVILVSDGTRLCPTSLLLGPLLEELNIAGIADQAIDIVVALGLHRKHTADELERLVGKEAYNRVRVHNHSPIAEDCVHVGTTSLGTPVEINRTVAEAPLRIVTGNIEPHSLVGVSGGVKAMIPGVASHRCIEANHSLSLKVKAAPGDPDNDIHRDLEQSLSFLPIDFLLNVIVNHDRQVIHAVAGHIIDAHRAGVSYAADLFVVPVEKRYDIVIVSPGGSPKDLQLYQSLKALRNAASFAKPGGALILVAECPEMLGNGIFQFWIETMPNRERMVARLQQNFVVGAHKILHIDEVLRSYKVYLHSSLPTHVTELLGFIPAPDLNGAIASETCHPDTTVAVMPFGALTYPRNG
ncbi:Lactate racemase [Paenibacillus allorhizosphaerae]|uniref:Lactate racemase n=2 Tax=Paenibacillus allorhizosphaerae TaxID=2849866 RepID=A0ABM8VMY6_9BACL|nr:Lactate racemase [Paenibacillus allorhizosphaerae]